MNSYQIELTNYQTLFLLDNTSIFALDLEVKQNVPLLQILRLKLLSGVLEESNTTLVFTGDELWILLEIAKSGAQVGQEKVGMQLIHSLGKALLCISNDYPAVLSDEIGTQFSREKLDQWRKTHNE